MRIVVSVTLPFLLSGLALAQAEFDLLLKGGHVIDGRNKITALRDVGIKEGWTSGATAPSGPCGNC